jgi:hypothetical protein
VASPPWTDDAEWLLPDEAETSRRLFQRFRPHLVTISMLGLLVLVIAIGPPSVVSPSSTAALPPIDRQLLWLPISPEQDPLVVRLRAFDWSGDQLGAVTLPCRAPCSFAPSPDGQRVLIAEQPAQGERPTPGAVYDARGRRVGTIADPTARWADDSRHLCLMRATGTPASAPATSSQVELDILDPEHGQDRVVASVSGVSSPSAPAYWDLLACSIKSDRAVVALSEQQGVHDIRVMQLSTGRTLYARDDLAPGASCGCPVASIWAAPNADIAAENLAGGGAQIVRFSTGVTTPWSSGASGSDEILGLSWHGQRALTSTGIFETSSGRLVWSAASAASVAIGASRPGSEDLLLYLAGPNGSAAREVIVLEDGRSLLINNVIPAA